MAIAELSTREFSQFDYSQAFSRNLGWVTASEQRRLAKSRVAIAGVGGVGGHYCEVMARLGVQSFHIADFDQFEIQNFNRQNASGMSTLNRSKVEVLRERILDINPEAEVRVFNKGIGDANIAEFLAGVDIYLDGLDFFQFDVRQIVFRACRERAITAVTVAPVGMGAAVVVFGAKSMRFEDYFGFTPGQPKATQALHFLLGLTPSMVQQSYLASRGNVDFSANRVPSLAMGCYLCAGVAATTALKILLGRGPVSMAPWSIHFDSYRHVLKKRYLWLGWRNPWQRLKTWLIRKFVFKSQ